MRLTMYILTLLVEHSLPSLCVDREARFIEFADCGQPCHELKSDNKIFKQKKGDFKEGDKIKVIYKKGVQGCWEAVDWEW